MDALCVLQMSKWVMAELVRVLHDVSTDDATAIVDSLTERDTPLIWEVGGKRRVLNTGLSFRDMTLLLLHATNGGLSDTELVSWLEHSNASVYRKNVLGKLHRERLIEYETADGMAQISPTGIADVEARLLPRFLT